MRAVTALGTVLSTTMALVVLPVFLQPATGGGATAPPAPATAVTAHQERSASASAAAPPVAESAVDGAPEAPGDPPPAPAAPDPCADALAWVAAAGLPLPPGASYRCPSDQFTHQGAACWNGVACPGTGFVAVNMDLMAGTSPAYLRHVVAHEICHILDFQVTGRSTESGADACAAAHGAPA